VIFIQSIQVLFSLPLFCPLQDTR